MNETSVELLKALTQADAIPGHEEAVRHILVNQLRNNQLRKVVMVAHNQRNSESERAENINYNQRNA